MNIDELSNEYQKQYIVLNAKMDGLRPLLYIYSGKDLDNLRRRLNAYYNMACECKCICELLTRYYDDEDKR